MNDEVKRQLNYLAGCPDFGHTTMAKEDCKEMLLKTGGNVIACGRLYDFVVKEIGADVCKVSLTLSNP